MSKNTIIKGTIILTLAGLLTRLMGFFYKIYLSNMLGAEKLGLYQLIFPVYGICFTLYAGGIQTAISNLIAAEQGRSALVGQKGARHFSNQTKRILAAGMVLSLTMALFLSLLVYKNADFIAASIILEAKCAASLRLLSFVFPFCGITACINGYYLGLKKAGVPAGTQLLEQVVRVLSVYILAGVLGKGDTGVTCELAVLGVVLGEIASNLYNIASLFVTKLPAGSPDKKNVIRPLCRLALPLMGNRFLINILHGMEAVLIPSMLRKSGLSSSEALSIYGVLTGMSIPFILFPSTITNALATFLLPTVSEAHAGHKQKLIDHTTSMAIKYSLIVGIFSTGIFLLFGNALGQLFFHNEKAGEFLVILSWLCPFMYLTTTLGSIINGLGKTHLTFINTVTGLSIRILFVIYMVPARGILGYLIGLLVSELSIGLLDCLSIYRIVHLSFDAIDWIVKPAIIFVFLGYFAKRFYDYFSLSTAISPLLLLTLFCIVMLVLFIILLFLTKTIRRDEFR